MAASNRAGRAARTTRAYGTRYRDAVGALRQFPGSLPSLDKTSLRPEDVGEYTGDEKSVRPVTISTYQMLTWRRSKSGEFEHFAALCRAFGDVVSIPHRVHSPLIFLRDRTLVRDSSPGSSEVRKIGAGFGGA